MPLLTVVKIIDVHEWRVGDKTHVNTQALLSDGETYMGYSRYEVGQTVEAYFSEKWDKPTMQPTSFQQKTNELQD
jgi:hypothetical protein